MMLIMLIIVKEPLRRTDTKYFWIIPFLYKWCESAYLREEAQNIRNRGVNHPLICFLSFKSVFVQKYRVQSWKITADDLGGSLLHDRNVFDLVKRPSSHVKGQRRGGVCDLWMLLVIKYLLFELKVCFTNYVSIDRYLNIKGISPIWIQFNSMFFFFFFFIKRASVILLLYW